MQCMRIWMVCSSVAGQAPLGLQAHTRVWVFHKFGAPVDWSEGDGADVEGIAGVVLDAHCIVGRLLARREHLPCLICDLLARAKF